MSDAALGQLLGVVWVDSTHSVLSERPLAVLDCKPLLLQFATEQPPPDDRTQHIQVGDVKHIDRRKILIKHDKVGLFSHLKRAHSMLLKARPGGVDGKSSQRLVQRQSLCRVPGAP